MAEISAFYESESPGLGSSFVDAVSNVFELLHGMPKLGVVIAATDRQLRKRQVSRLPYHVVSEVADDRLIVLAFGHHRRAPRYWETRK